MKKTVLNLERAAYEPPYVTIIEFAVEEGFGGSVGFDSNEGTEILGRDDVTNPWYSN